MALAGHCPAVLVPPPLELETLDPLLLDALVAPLLPLALVLPAVELPPLPLPELLVPEPLLPVGFDPAEPALHATPAGTRTATRASWQNDEA
jgi:hypothetical protein